MAQTEPVISCFRSYSTQAKKLYLEKKYLQASQLYSRSLETHSTDKHCLVARSKCYIRLGKPAMALADARLALQQDENFPEAVYQMAEAYFQQSNYEVALMVFYRGLKLRGRPDMFLNGIHKCEEAIEKSVHWLDQLPIYRSEEPMACGKKEGYAESMTSSECIKAQPTVPVPHRDKYQNLLEEVYHDKKFLKNILKRVEFKVESDWLSKLMIIDRLIYLNNQAKYLQTQKLATRVGNANTPQNIKDDLEEIQSTFGQKRYKDCIKECVKMAGDYDDTEWELRRKFILKLYSWIGASSMELKQWEKARCAFLALLWIGEWCRDDELRLKALGAISLCYKNDSQCRTRRDNDEETEEGEMSEIEEMNLYYYLGQCYLGLNNQKARGYGQMCYDTAIVGSSKEFMKSSLALMGCADTKLGHYEEAIVSLEECMQLMMGDFDGRKEIVEKSLWEANEALRRREQRKRDAAEEELKKRREEEKKRKEDEEKSKEKEKVDGEGKREVGGGWYEQDTEEEKRGFEEIEEDGRVIEGDIGGRGRIETEELNVGVEEEIGGMDRGGAEEVNRDLKEVGEMSGGGRGPGELHRRIEGEIGEVSGGGPEVSAQIEGSGVERGHGEEGERVIGGEIGGERIQDPREVEDGEIEREIEGNIVVGREQKHQENIETDERKEGTGERELEEEERDSGEEEGEEGEEEEEEEEEYEDCY